MAGADEREHPTDRLVRAAAQACRDLTDSELQQLRDHAAQAGFDPRPHTLAGGRLSGVLWQGRRLRGRDRLTAAEVHYLRHVVQAQEWPSGTSLHDYLQVISDLVLHPASGVFTSEYQGALQVGFVHRSGASRGPRGREWLLVEYRVDLAHWVTAYQLDWEDLFQTQRRNIRWLSEPR